MSDWKERKAERSKLYWKSHGAKLEICIACNGSGRYDHNGSPPCGACNGRGKVPGKPSGGLHAKPMLPR